MSQMPRVGYAGKGGRDRLHVPARHLPIVVVPDIFGTRLRDPDTGELVWNPLGAPFGRSKGGFAADFERLSQLSAALEPAELSEEEVEAEQRRLDEAAARGHEEPETAAQAPDVIRHRHAILPDFYGALLDQLAQAAGAVRERGFKPRVFCAGYDFRQDNAKSALRLAGIVDEALAETRERQVVVVAHGMGGLVARYYSRALGGESKIAAMFLVGSPTLGAPAAYLQLKNGIQAVYTRDVRDALLDGDAMAITTSSVEIGQGAIGLLSGLLHGEGVESLRNLFGDLYPLLSVGAGRWLSREEMLYFIRQIPSLYQLLPTSTYCRKDPNWLVFDPLATGYPPTGYMMVLPAILDKVIALAAGFDVAAASAATELQRDLENAVAPERTSGRTRRNMETLWEALQRVGANPDDSSQETLDTVSRIVVDIGKRAGATFIDGRSRERLYGDIYTGLLDRVSQRAICAYNLALAYRFDDALTIDPRPRKARSALDLVKKLLEPVVSTFGQPIVTLFGMIFGPSGATLADRIFGSSGLDQNAQQRQRTRDRREEEDADRPKVYVHPRTFNIYCEAYPVDSGGLLLPLKVVSNDDSNIVYWQLLPNFLAATLFASLPMGTSIPLNGDGTIPAGSANPPRALLSSEFVESWSVQHGDAPSGAPHATLASSDDVVRHVMDLLDDVITDLYA